MSDYWERRRAENMWEYMEDAEKAAEEIAKLYRRGYSYFSSAIQDIYERFRDAHNLTDEQARELLNTMQDPSDIEELKRKLQEPGNPERAELLAKLESAAYQHRILRLKAVQKQVDAIMTGIYKQELLISQKFYADLAENVYYKSIYETQRQTGLGFSFSLVDEETVEKVLHTRWSGKNYSERIWDNTEDLARRLKEELLTNFITGRTNREAAEAIAIQTGRGIKNARRLVRTESNYLTNQMEMRSYEECGIERYRFLATLDLRTSEACRKLDGKTFPVSEQEPGKNCPPMHPYCRSTTTCEITEEELARMKRRARNPETGRNEKVPASMTYQEWYDKYVKGNADAELNEKMIRNRSSDKKQFEQYQRVIGDETPETLAEFQQMKYTDSGKWNGLKHDYRIVNQYEVVAGKPSSKKIVELHEKNMEFRNNFRGGAGKHGNATILEWNKHHYYANSSIQNQKSKGYSKYKGNPEDLILLKPQESRVFATTVETSTKPPYQKWDRCIDGEAKTMEFLHDRNNRSKNADAYLVTDFPMCESCKGVLKQFKEQDANINLCVIERRTKHD